MPSRRILISYDQRSSGNVTSALGGVGGIVYIPRSKGGSSSHLLKLEEGRLPVYWLRCTGRLNEIKFL